MFLRKIKHQIKLYKLPLKSSSLYQIKNATGFIFHENDVNPGRTLNDALTALKVSNSLLTSHSKHNDAEIIS